MNIGVVCGYLDSLAPLAGYTVNVNKADYCKRYGYKLHIPRSSLPKYRGGYNHLGASGFSWSRLEYVLSLVDKAEHEWLWVVGADTLITNFNITLESIIEPSQTQQAEISAIPIAPVFKNSWAPPGVLRWRPPPGHKAVGKKHLLICGERVTSIQADSFLVRCTNEGGDYIRDILGFYPMYAQHPWCENQAMIDLRDKHAAITYIVAQHLMNSYDYSRWYCLGKEYRDGIDCYGNRGQWQEGDFLIHWPAASLQDRLGFLAKYKPLIKF